MKSGRVTVYTIGVANAVTVVDETEARETKSGNASTDARASSIRRLSIGLLVILSLQRCIRIDVPISEVVLLIVRHLVDELARLTVCLCPFAIS